MEIGKIRDEIAAKLKELGATNVRTRYTTVYFKMKEQYLSVVVTKAPLLEDKLAVALKRSIFFKGRRTTTTLYKDIYSGNTDQIIKALKKYGLAQ